MKSGDSQSAPVVSAETYLEAVDLDWSPCVFAEWVSEDEEPKGKP